MSVYGRDATDARVLAKLWRFCFYRDSGPTLILNRDLLVEHEAYLTLTAGRAGVLVPEVLAVGRFGASGDTAIVTRLPGGALLADRRPSAVPDGMLDEILARRAPAARGGHRPRCARADTILLSGQAVCIKAFRSASSPAPASRLDADLAAVLAAMAVRAGVDRTAAAAARVLDEDTARGALVHLQRAALDPVTVGALKEHKALLSELRTAVAAAAGIEVPKLAEPKRISWVNLVFGIGSLIGLWAIIGVLSDASGSLEVIKGASWGWVALAFVLAQLPLAARPGRSSGRYRAASFRPVPRAGDGGRVRRAGWRRRRRVRGPGAVLPAPGLRRGHGAQFRGDRHHGRAGWPGACCSSSR